MKTSRWLSEEDLETFEKEATDASPSWNRLSFNVFFFMFHRTLGSPKLSLSD